MNGLNRPVYLARFETVTALGQTISALWEGLMSGKSGIKPVTGFSTEAIPHKLGAVTGLTLDEMLNKVTEPFCGLPVDPYILWTGVKSNIPWIEGDRTGLPLLTTDRLDHVAKLIGAGGRGLAVNAACASSTAALGLGYELIRSGRERLVFVCGADTVSRFSHLGFSALKGLSESPARPFDNARDGLTLGDGAAGLLLCSDEDLEAVAGNAAVRISGWGLSDDANHITGPARDGRGLVTAMRTALEKAERQPEEVAAFCAHGTGTVYNDAMEEAACRNVFNGRILPAFSVKGAIGHTLGAAGGIEAALSALCLKERRIPPTAGFRQGDETSPLRISASPVNIGPGPLLTTNSGFGGINAALLLEEIRR